MKFKLAIALILVVALVITTVILVHNPEVPVEGSPPELQNVLEVTRQFHIPPLDLRGYEVDHFEMEQWFLERINYHREGYGIHPYSLYIPAVITSIEHSLDMRDNNFGAAAASDGRTHQQRHHDWLGYNRTTVTSAHTSSHDIEGPLTKEIVHEIVDTIFERERSRSFLLNPTYHYIGIGFSIQDNGRGRLSITMTTLPNERAAHSARNREERIEHRQQYLERVRYERGWSYQQTD